MKQGELRERSRFANTNTGHSTMATQASTGPRWQAALQAAGISDANQSQQTQGLQQLAQQQGSQQGAAAAESGGGDQPSSAPSSANPTAQQESA